MNGAIARSVVEAVALDGFQSKLEGETLLLEGTVKVQARSIPIRVEFDDLTFTTSPRLYVADLSTLPRRVMPHLDISGELCAVDRTYYLLDRHRVPGQIRGMLVRAREVLEQGLTKAATAEIAAEFPRHWAAQVASVNVQQSSGGVAIIDDEMLVNGLSIGIRGWMVSTRRQLSFAADQGRPETLGELLDWSGRWDAGLPQRILEGFARVGPNDPFILISAPNGIAIAKLNVSERGPRFQATLNKPKVWRAILAQPKTRSWGITRSYGRRSDLEDVLGRNGDGVAPLAGRSITLVGCGAIGGYLARMLAQSGAGLSGGSLKLVDADQLAMLNIRRHALGKPHVGKTKVASLKAQIDTDFPGLNVSALPMDVQKNDVAMAQADLIIDATGEQGVSEFLNEWTLNKSTNGQGLTPVLHVWIEGAGAAVQTFINVDSAFACYRCLQPNHDEPARFSPLYGKQPDPVAPCGEQPYTPYGPAAPAMAASLAVQHAIDWASGSAVPLLRTVAVRRELAHDVPPKSPPPKTQCPACSRAAPSK